MMQTDLIADSSMLPYCHFLSNEKQLFSSENSCFLVRVRRFELPAS